MAYVDIIVKGRRGVEELRNIYTIETVGVFDTAVAEAASDEVWSVYDELWQPLATDDFELYGVDYRNVTAPGFPTIPAQSGSLVGSNPGGETAPPQLAMLIRMLSTEPRPNRGRKYIFGLPKASLTTEGQVDSVYLAAMQSFADGLLAGFASVSGATWVIARRDAQGVVTAANPVELVQVPNKVFTQRRRANGR